MLELAVNANHNSLIHFVSHHYTNARFTGTSFHLFLRILSLRGDPERSLSLLVNPNYFSFTIVWHRAISLRMVRNCIGLSIL